MKFYPGIFCRKLPLNYLLLLVAVKLLVDLSVYSFLPYKPFIRGSCDNRALRSSHRCDRLFQELVQN
ncbi:hypothetical protein Holit_00307 [Hollandina sp. SP2]